MSLRSKPIFEREGTKFLPRIIADAREKIKIFKIPKACRAKTKFGFSFEKDLGSIRKIKPFVALLHDSNSQAQHLKSTIEFQVHRISCRCSSAPPDRFVHFQCHFPPFPHMGGHVPNVHSSLPICLRFKLLRENKIAIYNLPKTSAKAIIEILFQQIGFELL